MTIFIVALDESGTAHKPLAFTTFAAAKAAFEARAEMLMSYDDDAQGGDKAWNDPTHEVEAYDESDTVYGWPVEVEP